ncbi:unnamed protein product [Moneuplotes crassus]|uniref:Protein kinase domain-containing protein n=1 Tax=Euplotes crassus TaxID=5936 RepID=A0AAD2D617_EUPCR|nr:unnamed protein product [Moneuplotes crassus]
MYSQMKILHSSISTMHSKEAMTEIKKPKSPYISKDCIKLGPDCSNEVARKPFDSNQLVCSSLKIHSSQDNTKEDSYQYERNSAMAQNSRYSKRLNNPETSFSKMNFDKNIRGKTNAGYIKSVMGRNTNYENLNQYIKKSMSKKLENTRIDLSSSINNSDFKQPVEIYRKTKDGKFIKGFGTKAQNIGASANKHLANDSKESLNMGSFNSRERKFSNLDDSEGESLINKQWKNLSMKKHVGTLSQIAQEIPKKYGNVVKKIPQLHCLSNHNHNFIRKGSRSIKSKDNKNKVHVFDSQKAIIPKSYRIDQIGLENEYIQIREDQFKGPIDQSSYSKRKDRCGLQSLLGITPKISDHNYFGYHTLENSQIGPSNLGCLDEKSDDKIPSQKDKSLTELRVNQASSRISESSSGANCMLQRHCSKGKITDFYTISEIIIGKGSYGVVKLGHRNILPSESNSECKKVAIKIYEKAVVSKKQKIGSLDQEVNALKSLKHQNIIRLYDFFEDSHCIYLVTEYIAGESLLTYMKRKPTKRCNLELSREIFKQILNGITFCHSKGFAHRDIKLENILVTKQENKLKTVFEAPLVKIIDFGFARQYQNGEKGSTYCGTPNYMAPELIKKQLFDYELADVWALGVVFYALMTGFFPFKGASNKDMFSKIIKGNYIIPERINIGPKRLIMKMLQVNPEHRSHLKDITDKWLMQDSDDKLKAHRVMKKQLFDQLHSSMINVKRVDCSPKQSPTLSSKIMKQLNGSQNNSNFKESKDFIKSYFTYQYSPIVSKGGGKLPPINRLSTSRETKKARASSLGGTIFQ